MKLAGNIASVFLMGERLALWRFLGVAAPENGRAPTTVLNGPIAAGHRYQSEARGGGCGRAATAWPARAGVLNLI